MALLDSTKAELLQATDRLLALLESTPDDRLRWKPTESSRSILEIAAHIGHALTNILSQMKGTPFPIRTSAEANEMFLAHDAQFTTRDEVTAYVITQVKEYVAFLDSLAETDLDRVAPLPFGLGEAPLRDYIVAAPAHTKGHIAQIEYIQTMYGDRDWHFGF